MKFSLDLRWFGRLHAAALVATLGVTSLTACGNRDRPTDFPAAVLDKLQASLDADHPGRGMTDYPSDLPDDIPKAYAMVLLGEIARGRLLGAGEVPRPGPVAGTWLLDHADENRDGVTGWGVPIAWDAYGDGSINPANTEYAISTAISIHALLDWAEVSDKAPRQRILDTVEKALLPYLDSRIRSPAGMSPYSLKTSDRPYDTFNPAAYLAGQMQRFSRITNDAAMAAKLREAADSTMRALLAHKQINPEGGDWYWNYSIQEAVPNDLPHASYIVDGIVAYLVHGGQLSDRFDRPKVVAHLLQFLDAKGEGLRAWPRFKADVTMPARLYDLGIAMHVACSEQALAPMRGKLFAQVPAYLGADGHYMKYPLSSERPNLVVAEYEAYLFRGLASCAAETMRVR